MAFQPEGITSVIASGSSCAMAIAPSQSFETSALPNRTTEGSGSGVGHVGHMGGTPSRGGGWFGGGGTPAAARAVKGGGPDGCTGKSAGALEGTGAAGATTGSEPAGELLVPGELLRGKPRGEPEREADRGEPAGAFCASMGSSSELVSERAEGWPCCVTGVACRKSSNSPRLN